MEIKKRLGAGEAECSSKSGVRGNIGHPINCANVRKIRIHEE
jgi:hypothetical protein